MADVVCAWCGTKITSFVVPRCRRCDKAMCNPILRDCAYEHWRVQHLGKPKRFRRVRDVETRGQV